MKYMMMTGRKLRRLNVMNASQTVYLFRTAAVSSQDPPAGTPYDGLYVEAPPERGTFFRLEVYKRVLGISRAEV